jgi:hypothetical protein
MFCLFLQIREGEAAANQRLHETKGRYNRGEVRKNADSWRIGCRAGEARSAETPKNQRLQRTIGSECLGEPEAHRTKGAENQQLQIWQRQVMNECRVAEDVE